MHRLLETVPSSGGWNMACDRAILDAVERGAAPATLRFYGWDPPAVSIGHNQPQPGPKARDVLAEMGADWVRRPTGGRAVWHGPPHEELTYSVIGRLDVAPLTGGLVDVYRRIHEALVAGLRTLGVDATLVARGRRRPPIPPSSRLACFAATAPGEVQAGGRKLVGSAQRRTRHAFLQHGSIPLAGNHGTLSVVWPGSPGPARPTTLAEAAGRPVGPGEVAGALAGAFREMLGVDLVEGDLSPEERAAIGSQSAALA